MVSTQTREERARFVDQNPRREVDNVPSVVLFLDYDVVILVLLKSVLEL